MATVGNTQTRSKNNHGEKAFIIESGRIIREVIVIRVVGGMCTLKFTDTGGGVRLREGRLYPSNEAAMKAIESVKQAH